MYVKDSFWLFRNILSPWNPIRIKKYQHVGAYTTCDIPHRLWKSVYIAYDIPYQLGESLWEGEGAYLAWNRRLSYYISIHKERDLHPNAPKDQP